MKKKAYLPHIHSPKDLAQIPIEEMPCLAEEIRTSLVETVSKTGGHLASNLGVVELTLAIHRVFSTPHDHVIFDVGHQCYVHKMLTGRYERMETIRQAGGIGGFPKREESEHDCFGTGHSSTSLSAALGFAISDKLCRSDAYTVAVIGDGAYTGGMIHEALNNCRKDLNLIIIMNENEMSISKNIGRFATNLAKLRTRSGYFKTKRATGKILRHIPLIGRPLFRLLLGTKKAVKNALYGSNYFESMGLTYLGPIDGNDYHAVEHLLTEAKKLNESVVVHLKTQKGKGFTPAEQAPDRYHGMIPDGEKKKETPTFSSTMGAWLTERAESDDRICAITAAMADGTGLECFSKRHPDRFFDVGIAEAHAATFAAGLSANGMRPFFAVYSTFLQRAYDSIIHDVALQKLPVVFCIDRAGLNASDGATHHGIFDVSFLSHIPGIKIYTPATHGTLRAALEDAYKGSCPSAIRYPSGTESEEICRIFYADGQYGTPGVRYYSPTENPALVIITHGRIVAEALSALRSLEDEGISAGILLLEYIKPYDTLSNLVMQHTPPGTKLLFLEEEIRSGGFGVSLSDVLLRQGVIGTQDFSIMAIEDHFVELPKIGESTLSAAGLSCEHIVKQAKHLIKK